MEEITDFRLTIADPEEFPWNCDISRFFEVAREGNYLVARCTFRSGGEKAISLHYLSRELESDGAIDLDAYYRSSAQHWADSNPLP